MEIGENWLALMVPLTGSNCVLFSGERDPSVVAMMQESPRLPPLLPPAWAQPPLPR